MQLPCAVVEWCMSVCVRHPVVRAAAARRWLRGPRCEAALPALARRAARSPAGPAAELLLVCLAGAPIGEPLVSEKGVSEVVQTLSEAISLTTSPTLEASAALASRLASTLQEHSASQHYAQLVQGLFRLNILVPRGDSRLSVDTWCEVRSSWQDGVAALPERQRELFLSKAGEFLHRQLFDNIEDLNIPKIENIVSPCGDIFNRGEDAKCPEDLSEIVSFTQRLFELPEPEARAVEVCALRYECVTSQLCCLDDGREPLVRDVVRDAASCDVKDLTKPDLMAYVQKYLFRAIYLRTLLLQKINSDDDDEESPELMTWCDVLLQDERIQEHFCKVLYNYVVIYSLHEGYAFWPHYDIIEQTKQKLDVLLADVIVASRADVRAGVLRAVGERARMRGGFWAVARRWYCAHAAVGCDDVLHDFTLDDIVAENGFFHSLQACSKWSQDSEAAYRLQFLVMLHSWHGAHAAVSDERELRDVLRCRERCDLDVVINAYYRHNHTMLYERDISDVPWRSVLSNVAVVEFLTAMVKSRGWDAPAHHWDFTTITLCSLLCSMEKSKRNWTSTKVSMLSRAVLRLLCAVREFVRGIRSECERRQPLPHVADLMAEWNDIFAPDTHYNLLSFMMHVLDSCTARDMTSTQTEVISELITCTKLLDWETLPSAYKLGALSLVRLARCAAGTLQQPAHHAYKYLAYYLLRALAKPLVLDDAEKLSLWSEDSSGDGDEEKERPQFSLDHFHDAFSHLHEIVEAALSTIVLGEATCEIEAMSDSYSMALGWLLLAEIIATVCQLARGDLTHHYIQIYRERKYAEPLITAALRLLPDEVFLFASDSSDTAAAPPHYSDMFVKVKDFSVHEAALGEDVCALACRSVFSTLCGAGCGPARGWWGAAAARAARLLERLVRAYVAPPAARDQLLSLHQRAAEIDDAEIRIAWSSNEVTCVYNVEERLIELRVWLSPAHPLTPPRLAAPHTVGPGANTHWVALYLAYQNGTLLNALKMWTQAVSAKVESSPQCYICYCRLHPNTGRLPRVLCYQCKNKFHNMCLRKWFTTSNKSNCPLCRSNF